MIKKNLLITSILILSTSIPAQAFEDCIVFTNGKLTDINIENNNIIDVTPLVTIGNEKNTLIVHPLNSGQTRFCVLKNNKSLALFEVEVTDYGTIVNAPNGFEVLSLDAPEGIFDFDLDEPPEEND